MLNMKRSSCASGSGYVPSSSIGFCVANTKNGGSSGYVRPAAVTCPYPRGAARTTGNLFRSAAYDPWGDTVQDVLFVDHTGTATVALPAGRAVALVASHGPEWSVSPDTWPADLGTAFGMEQWLDERDHREPEAPARRSWWPRWLQGDTAR